MLWLPEDLGGLNAEGLYRALRDLQSLRTAEGRGRSPEAQHVRSFCKSAMARVRRELTRRGLPARREDWTWVGTPPASARAS